MALEAKWVAFVLTQVGDEWEIGTAYPIGQNVILTARHVIPDIKQYKQTCLQWRDDAEKKVIEEHYLQEILYESEKYDLLVARCKTPDNTPIVDISSSAPSSTEEWGSHGYPRSGKYDDREYRHRQPAKGSFFPEQDNFIQHLDVKGDVKKASLWQGMSGAPVFLAGQNKLVAVIIETPAKDDSGEEVYKDRLYAVSMAYVLKHDKAFQQAVDLNKSVKFCRKQKKRLIEHLTTLQQEHNDFYTALATTFKTVSNPKEATLCQAIIKDLQQDRAKCIKKLRLCCESYIKQGLNAEIERLLVLLLGYLCCEEQRSVEHFHDLNVRTHLLTELLLAARYRVIARFKRQQVLGGVAGAFVLSDDLATKEVGVDPKPLAQEQASNIAYRIYKQHEPYEPLSQEDMDADEWEGLSVEIQERREGEDAELHRFEVDKNRLGHPLLDEEVRKELHRLLPELPIALFDKKAKQTNETKLRTQVKLFYEKLYPIITE